MEETVQKWGRLDVLVNNASFQGKSVEKFEDISRERLEFTFHSNILNYFTTSQAAVKHLKEGSAIINIASIQRYSPSPGVLDYSCTKVSYPTLSDAQALLSSTLLRGCCCCYRHMGTVQTAGTQHVHQHEVYVVYPCGSPDSCTPCPQNEE